MSIAERQVDFKAILFLVIFNILLFIEKKRTSFKSSYLMGYLSRILTSTYMTHIKKQLLTSLPQPLQGQCFSTGAVSSFQVCYQIF